MKRERGTSGGVVEEGAQALRRALLGSFVVDGERRVVVAGGRGRGHTPVAAYSTLEAAVDTTSVRGLGGRKGD